MKRRLRTRTAKTRQEARRGAERDFPGIRSGSHNGAGADIAGARAETASNPSRSTVQRKNSPLKRPSFFFIFAGDLIEYIGGRRAEEKCRWSCPNSTGRSRSPRGDRRSAAPHRAGRRRDRNPDRNAGLRDRCTHRLSPDAAGRGAAGDGRAGLAGAAGMPRAMVSRWCRAAPAHRCRAARCRSPTACSWAWRNSTASSTSITRTAASWRSRASPISPSPRRWSRRGFYYAPDPSSQIACTIGGNVAENSGGVHCLKYGLTTNNVLGVEMVLMTGEVVCARRQASRQRRLRSLRSS